jgi:signal transduction histidine kinase
MDLADPGRLPSGDSKPAKTAAFWFAVSALLLSALLSVLSAAFSQSTLNSLNEMADRRKAALVGQLQLERFMSLLKDLETGQRGFVITGQAEYLEPYRAAVKQLPAAYSAVIENIKLPAEQGFDWVKFERTVSARKAQAEALVVERQQRGEQVLKDPSLFGAGRQIMDQIRANIATLNAAQSQRIDELEAQMQILRATSSRHGWVSSIFSGLMITASVALFIVERRRRERLEAKLRTDAALLEQRVAQRTEELASASSQIRKFSIRLESSIEAEHRRISREVHDQLGQIFTAIKMIFHSIKPGSMAPDQRLAMTSAIDTGVATTRRIAAELRPPLLDDLGLVAALEQYVQGVAQSFKLNGSVHVSGHEVLTESQSLQLFRVVQEACTNAGRHAQAQNLVVAGKAVENGFELSIEDDGKGIEPALMRDGALGLVGLRERAAMMGGQMRVEGRTGGGTRVWIRIPLHWTRARSPTTTLQPPSSP